MPGVGVLACAWVSTKPSPIPVLLWGDSVCRDVGKPTSQCWVHQCSPTGMTATVGEAGLRVLVVIAPNLLVNFFKLCRSS